MTAAIEYLGAAVRVTRRVPRSLQFLASGGLGYLLGAGLLYLLVDRFAVGAQLAYVIQVVLTIAFVWVLNRYVTWHDHQGGTANTVSSFLASRGASLVLAWAIFSATQGRHLGLAGHQLVVHYQLANALGVGVSTVANYLACKYIVFADRAGDAARGPTYLARMNRTWLRRIALAGLLSGTGVAVVLAPKLTLMTGWAVNALVMTVVATLSVSRMIYGWQTPERVSHVDLDYREEPAHTFTLIVPARKEPILPRTLQRLLESDYPRHLYQVLVVIADDDPETELLAREVEAQFGNVRVLIDRNLKKSKPHSLETARPHCTGELIGIVDAESVFAPKLLSYVNSLSARNPQAAIFQGGVQLMNHRAHSWHRPEGAGLLRAAGNWINAGTSWWRARNCLEYFIWFKSRLRYQAEARFVPLGGNTVFIRKDILDDLGGWDPECLTEDCELGVRASARGVQVVVFHHPDLVTREETPDTLTSLVIQRTRWMTGFMQVLFKGDWRALPLRRRLLALDSLTMPFFQAYSGFSVILSAVLTFTLRAPVPLVLWTWLPLLVTAVNVTLEHGAYREFTRSFDLPSNLWDSVRLIVCSPLYQLVLAAAAIRATLRLARGATGWEKTAHSGRHMGATDISDLPGLVAT